MILKNKKYIIIIIIFFTYSYNLQNKFENLYKNITYGEFIVEIISNKEEKENNNKYICLVKKVNDSNNYKNTKLLLYTNKNNEYSYGDILKIEGFFEYAKQARNSNGYNYRKILWQKNIYGILKSEKIEKISNKKSINSLINNLKIKMENNIDNSLSNSEISNFVKSIILGEKNELSQNIIENFRDSGLSHILAVSGMHIAYLILIIKKTIFFINNKKIKNIICMILLFFYIILIGYTPSSIRAFTMFIMYNISELFYRKSNITINWCMALIVVLLINPYNIENIGVWLSFFGTLGIIILYTKIEIKNKKRFLYFFYNSFLLSFCIWLFIVPIIVYNYNTISLSFFISNIVATFLIPAIIVIGFIIAIFGDFYFLGKIELLLSKIILQSTNLISKFCISKIYLITPSIIFILLYYMFLLCIIKKCFRKYLKIIIVFLFIIVFSTYIINYFNNELCINFLDVGQGDCTVIKTTNNKVILIDGGNGGDGVVYDEGSYTVLPYLLDKGIIKLDYVIVSHFDNDHIRPDY